MFTVDVFISYAHIDDETFIPGEKGWITTFHNALEKRLAQQLGERVQIWRDIERLEGNDMFAEKIVSQFSKTAIMISVITPRYIKSEWCIKEVNEFVRVAESNIGVRVNDKLRIFKVIKTPVEINLHPKELQGTLGYNFYTKHHI